MITFLAGIATMIIGASKFEGWLMRLFIIIGIGLTFSGWTYLFDWWSSYKEKD